MTKTNACPKTHPLAVRRAPSKAAADLLARADAYALLAQRARSSVSLYLFNDGKVLDSIANGGDVMTRAIEKANAELDRRLEALKAAPAQTAKPAKPRAKAKPAPRQAASYQAAPAMQARAKPAPRKTAHAG